jgi:hypothetical protein
MHRRIQRDTDKPDMGGIGGQYQPSAGRLTAGVCAPPSCLIELMRQGGIGRLNELAVAG